NNSSFFKNLFELTEHINKDFYTLTSEDGRYWILEVFDRQGQGFPHDGFDIWSGDTGKREYSAWVNPDRSITIYFPEFNLTQKSKINYDAFIDSLFIKRRFKLIYHPNKTRKRMLRLYELINELPNYEQREIMEKIGEIENQIWQYWREGVRPEPEDS
ncbi:MAG: hypothetical protein ACE5HX_16430, partial [bacterium]